MKNKKKKIVLILLTILSIISIGITTYAHSGRTDASGGHKDNKNKSGLGSYHYHCGGHPAHLHPNGVCPYAVPTTVSVRGIKINESINGIEIGTTQKLTVTITPDNATDKSITWKSSNENVATVSQSGEVVAKKAGSTNITATTSNGKTSTITINVKEEQKPENTRVVQTSTASMNSINTNANTSTNYNVNAKTNITNNSSTNIGTMSNTQEDTNPASGILALGLLGGGGYWVYRKVKK